jgi:CHAT domain-containing protein
MTTMTRILNDVGQKLLTPLAQRLEELHTQRLYLVPGLLGLLPLPAAPTTKNGQTLYFGQRFQITYIPSAAVLQRCHERAHTPDNPTLVALANPDGTLAFADQSVQTIASLFKHAKVQHGTNANKSWLHQTAPQGDYLELSTHGSFVLQDPLNSSLLLASPTTRQAEEKRRLSGTNAPQSRLTLEELLSGNWQLKPGCIVTLDACETSLMDLEGEGGEALGLPAGFLLAGAAAVIGSLWAVDDLATALLMERTYQGMLDGKGPRALQEAQAWLRQLPRQDVLNRIDEHLSTLQDHNDPRTNALRRLLWKRRHDIATDPSPHPFAHPFWWAAFVAHGAWP